LRISTDQLGNPASGSHQGHYKQLCAVVVWSFLY
jgi:hypothetical protein